MKWKLQKFTNFLNTNAEIFLLIFNPLEQHTSIQNNDVVDSNFPVKTNPIYNCMNCIAKI